MAKKQKKNKKKLSLLILLLLITVVMLGTSTYAWFTANRVVTINQIDVKVEASNGLQISTDASTWKTVITNDDITSGYTGANNILPATVTAVSTNGAITNHLMDMYSGVIGNDDEGNYTIFTNKENEASTTSANGKFVAFDVFLKVDKDEQIYLTQNSSVVNKDTDKGLQNSARVAFVEIGTGESSKAPGELIRLNNSAAAKAFIWEPNADAHADTVKNQLSSQYGVSLVANDKTPYYGINGAFTTPQSLIETVNGTNTDNSELVTPDLVTLAAFGTELDADGNKVEDYKQVFSLSAGVTKMRIYMWVEGQDIDCENYATGASISYNLQFAITD